MAKAKQGFKRKRSKTALPLWAAAGVSLAMAGGASANAPVIDTPPQDSGKRIVLAEEEVFDVSLATFYVFDKEFDKEREFSPGVRLAGGRCGGHGGGCGCHVGGCGGGGCAARGCRGCGGCGCGVGLGLLLGGLIGGCGGCGGGYGTCWVWSPAYGRWINVCY